MSDNIFEGDTPPIVVPPVAPTLQIPTEVAELVGQGKKYQSVEEALKSVPHAQKHIKDLETELVQLKEEVMKRKSTEEIIEEFRLGNVQPGTPPANTSITQETIEQTVANLLARKESETKAGGNVSKVIATFVETFGDKEKAEAEFLKIAEASGLSIDMLNNLAATSPEAVFKLAGFQKKIVPPGKITSSINTESLHSGQPQSLTAKVKQGATTKDLTQAWKNAGDIVKQKLSVG